MTNKDCPAGFKWDYLLVVCVKNESRQTPEHNKGTMVVVDQLRASVASVRASSGLMVGPALWSCVALATLGSIVALAVWLFIYRRRRRPSSPIEASLSGQELILRTEAPSKPPPAERNRHTVVQGAAEPGSPCHQLHTETPQGLRFWDGFTACGGPTMHLGSEGGPALPAGISEHRIPLPATELGGTVLVTTKTM